MAGQRPVLVVLIRGDVLILLQLNDVLLQEFCAVVDPRSHNAFLNLFVSSLVDKILEDLDIVVLDIFPTVNL